MARMLAYLAPASPRAALLHAPTARCTLSGNSRESEVAAVTDSAPKSAYELAMERLRQKDQEGASSSARSPSEQKTAIAEARRVYEAKVAEREILHRAAVRQAKSHEEVQKLNEESRAGSRSLTPGTATARSPRFANARPDRPGPGRRAARCRDRPSRPEARSASGRSCRSCRSAGTARPWYR